MAETVHFGTMVTDRLGNWPHPYFLPATSPFSLQYKESTWEKLILAQGALGELSAATRIIRPSELSFKLALLQEALASSRIEGTQASLVEVVEAEMDNEIHNADVEEVLNYQDAMNFAIGKLKELPISRRLICATHTVLMTGVRGATKTPGVFRKTPVWIGSYDSTPERAKFVPPLAHHLTDLFADWEVFVQDRDSMPLVAQIAWAHYQFETIHPFLDGNGRIGRIAIELMLVARGILDGPYLGISRYVERFRNEYYEVLQRVRTHGDVDGLLRYFAAAIESQALETVAKLEGLLALREQWLSEFGSEAKLMPKLIGLMIEQPILNVAFVTSNLGVTQPTASKLLRQAQHLGLLVSRGQLGRGRKETWVAQQVWGILSPYEAP